MSPDASFVILFAAISLLSAAAAILVTGRIQSALRRYRRGGDPVAVGPTETDSRLGAIGWPIRYVFRDGRLRSAISSDDPFLDVDVDPKDAVSRLSSSLSTLDGVLPDRIAELMARGASFVTLGKLGLDEIIVAGYPEREDLVIIAEPAVHLARTAGTRSGVLSAVQNLTTAYRNLHDVSDDLQWREADTLGVTWANPAYLALASELDREGDAADGAVKWPLPRIFSDQLEPPPVEGSLRRCQLVLDNEFTPRWFEVRAKYVVTGEALFNARPIDRLVTSEAALRDFVQTLAKTFANLSTGLAVFDRSRELVMFNPALVTISTLDASYLSGRPTLSAFLDHLRERNRMPEPRDYRNWRDEIARLERGAEADSYHELWTLAGGESIRVTGRPHPDGAIAFMFEDISREMTLTRQLRSDLGLWKAAMDSASEALLVADREGRVLHVNAAYQSYFGAVSGAADAGQDTALAPETLEDAEVQWNDRFDHATGWDDIRRLVQHQSDRSQMTLDVTTHGGDPVLLRGVPLPDGQTAIWFTTPDVIPASGVRQTADVPEPVASSTGGQYRRA